MASTKGDGRAKPRTAAQKAQIAATKDKARAAAAESRRKTREAHGTGIPHSVRWAKLLDGTLTVEELDDEEVAHGRLRNRDGSFTGRRPAIPSSIAQAMRKEYMRRIGDKFTHALPELVDVLVEIAKNPEVKEADRIKAINMVTDRVMGRAVETVRFEGASPFDSMLADAVGLDRDMVVDAEEQG